MSFKNQCSIIQTMRLLLFLSIGIWLACNTAKKEDPVLKEAAEAHRQALEVEKAVAPLLGELVQVKNNLNVQGRTLTPEEQSVIQAVESIEASYSRWEETHVEVPGYEHEAEGDSHAGHDHGPKLDLSPQDMLLVQRELRDTILALQQRVENALQQAKQLK
jgi:hypothetical protein